MTDERPDLAAQAASWVPPWERAQRPPDPAYAAQARAAVGENDGEELDEANLADDDDDFDPAFEGPSPARGDGVPAELPPYSEETGGPATVDSPREVPGDVERAPTDIGVGPEVPVPGAIEEAAENEIGSAPTVDAPLDGDDAGDVFDAAADDDVTDDGELDMPFTEEVPGPEEDDESAPGSEGGDESAPGPGDSDESTQDADDDNESTPGSNEDDEVKGVAETGDDGPAETVGGPESRDSGDDWRASDAESASGSQSISTDTPAALRPDEAWALGAADLEAAIAGGAQVARTKPSSGIPAQTRTGKGAGAASVATLTRTVEGAEGDAEPAPMDDGELRAALEAILLVVDEPVAELQLAQIVGQPAERVARMLDDISARYTAAGHGFDLRRAAGGWRLYTRPEYAAYVERFVLDGQSVRLTQAALETLAVVAYKQPVTRSRISAIRGVNCDGVMRTLNTRGLIEECGTEGETGAFLYRTTALFLEKLGLNSVDQLPPLAPFLPDDVEEVLDASG